ncbi:MAG TPA: chromate efflux transporter, partial [Longimicrobiales bacterium]|nr:chromate efflux transporter [Longimicrobiales bacterium]
MPTRWQLARYFLWLGSTGFGGPIALLGHMERDLVGQRAWFAQEEFRRGVVFAQLAPGPMAAQLAIYLGWLRGGVSGATVAGLAFVGPSLVMVIALAVAYEALDGLAWLRAAFYGVSAAVIAVIARGAIRLTRLTVRRDPLMWLVFFVNAIVTVLIRAESIGLLLGSGALVLLVREPHVVRRVVARVGLPAFAVADLSQQSAPALGQLFLYFCNAGAVVFGSGLAIVPFLYATVARHGWLTEQQFLDAIAVSLITPGPVVITVAFIGHLVSGLPGALVAAAGVFLPVYLVTVV